MREHLAYLRYVLRHKWFVFLECCRLGVPWLGIIHDLSRFAPDEWFSYVASQPYTKATKPLEITQAFEDAWNNHQHRNRHHWERWVHFDYHTHEMRPLPMPDRYRREMVADWRGASRAKGWSGDVRTWYMANGAVMRLHPATRYWIEHEIGVAGEMTSA